MSNTMNTPEVSIEEQSLAFAAWKRGEYIQLYNLEIALPCRHCGQRAESLILTTTGQWKYACASDNADNDDLEECPHYWETGWHAKREDARAEWNRENSPTPQPDTQRKSS